MTADAVWTLLTICTGMLVVIGGILALRLHAFLALTLGALVVAAMTPVTEDVTIAARVASGFGTTAGKIGILIALASVVGSCLMASGAVTLATVNC